MKLRTNRDFRNPDRVSPPFIRKRKEQRDARSHSQHLHDAENKAVPVKAMSAGELPDSAPPKKRRPIEPSPVILGEDPLIRRSDVELLTGMSESTLRRRVREGAFPRPRQIGKKAYRWSLSEVVEWTESRPVV